jgi:hypothetical protein
MGQVDGGLVHVVALVVSGGDGAELPELAEAALDGVALVASGVENRRAPADPAAGAGAVVFLLAVPAGMTA